MTRCWRWMLKLSLMLSTTWIRQFRGKFQKWRSFYFPAKCFPMKLFPDIFLFDKVQNDKTNCECIILINSTESFRRSYPGCLMLIKTFFSNLFVNSIPFKLILKTLVILFLAKNYSEHKHILLIFGDCCKYWIIVSNFCHK